MSRNRVLDSHVAPYSFVCLIEMYRITHEGNPVSFVNRSTGFLIAPNVLLTAGHSLNETDSRIQRLELYPSQNSQVKSSRKYVVEYPDFVIKKVPEYNNPNCYVKDDYGVIILKKGNLPDWTNAHFDWQESIYANATPNIGETIRIAGYPIDKPDFEMWEEAGGVVETTNHCLLHPFTTTKRNSGSPIWTEENGKPKVVAIHVSGNAASCGAKPENRPFGSSVLITPKVFSTIETWIQETKVQDSNKDFRLAL